MAGSRGRAGRRRDGARRLFRPGVVDLQLRAARQGAGDDGALVKRPDDGVVGRGDCREADEVGFGDGQPRAAGALPGEAAAQPQVGRPDGGGGDDPAAVGVEGFLEAGGGEAEGGGDGDFLAGLDDVVGCAFEVEDELEVVGEFVEVVEVFIGGGLRKGQECGGEEDEEGGECEGGPPPPRGWCESERASDPPSSFGQPRRPPGSRWRSD